MESTSSNRFKSYVGEERRIKWGLERGYVIPCGLSAGHARWLFCWLLSWLSRKR